MIALSNLSFPSARAAWLPVPREAFPSGLFWRDARNDDLPFLRQLYGDTRAAELSAVPWPEATRRAFLDSQFALQHHHYTTHYQPADYLVIEHAGQPMGRLYLHSDGREATVIDIALLAGFRGCGIGSTLLREVQQAAARNALDAVVLHVEMRNTAARKLYETMHFVAEGEVGHHLRMRWRVAPTVS